MKFHRTTALALALGLTLTACSGGSESETPSADGGSEAADNSVLTVAIQDEVEGLDIQQIGWENMVQALIYEPLVVFNEDLSELQPAFAESFTVAEDGSYIEFVLPADAKFSNGDVCDAEAVKASEERFLAISEYAGDLDAMESIEVVDAQTIRYHLSGPAPYMWASLTSTYGGINDVAVAETMSDDEFNRQPVTNGPYYVEEWAQGSQVVLKRNEYYKTNNPNVDNQGILAFDTIIVRFIPDEFTRVSELESGDVDVIYDVPSSSIADLEENPDITTYRYQQAGVSYLNMQTEKGVTADIKVRQALTLAVDRQEILDALDGVVTPTYGFISEAQAGYSAGKEAELAEKLAYNPEQAKALLAEAGWADTDGDGFVDKDGQKLTFELLVASDRASIKAAAPVLQNQFAAIGVDAQIREYEGAYIKQLMKDDDYTMGGRNFVWNDADILYYVFTAESGYPWDDPALTDALVAARTENDTELRVKAYEAAQDILVNDYKAISLFADNYCVATKSNIKGLVVTNDGRSWYNDTVRE
ncbi:MAG: ABC transporter substrate-binding protein [Clostridiales bacterium]|nr:ABC transporter substrate-binding protein [Clostridiales bacterium]